MTHEPSVVIHSTKDALNVSVSKLFLTELKKILAVQQTTHIVLTGGGMGQSVLEAIADSEQNENIPWHRVHFWWGDERFLDKNDPERNEVQSRNAFLDQVIIPKENIHPFPSKKDFSDLDQAAVWYETQLAKWAPAGHSLPQFDITFLGVGPDGHVASLFPDGAGIRERTRLVIAEKNSPKPPAERLSLTRPALNTSKHIWLVLCGKDKAAALGLALAGASYTEVPVSGIQGTQETIFFVDSDAALNVPRALLEAERDHI